MKNLNKMQRDVSAITEGKPMDEKLENLVRSIQEYAEENKALKDPRSFAAFLFVVAAASEAEQNTFDGAINRISGSIMVAHTGINPGALISELEKELKKNQRTKGFH